MSHEVPEVPKEFPDVVDKKYEEAIVLIQDQNHLVNGFYKIKPGETFKKDSRPTPGDKVVVHVNADDVVIKPPVPYVVSWP
ncbi:hypothetical protein ACP4OV_017351 [Aristida adscensionis]